MWIEWLDLLRQIELIASFTQGNLLPRCDVYSAIVVLLLVGKHSSGNWEVRWKICSRLANLGTQLSNSQHGKTFATGIHAQIRCLSYATLISHSHPFIVLFMNALQLQYIYSRLGAFLFIYDDRWKFTGKWVQNMIVFILLLSEKYISYVGSRA